MRPVKNASFELDIKSMLFNCYYISFQDMQSFFWVSGLSNSSLSY